MADVDTLMKTDGSPVDAWLRRVAEITMEPQSGRTEAMLMEAAELAGSADYVTVEGWTLKQALKLGRDFQELTGAARQKEGRQYFLDGTYFLFVDVLNTTLGKREGPRFIDHWALENLVKMAARDRV